MSDCAPDSYMMSLRVNGKDREFGGTSVMDLVGELGLAGKNIVVELNGTIVHREDYGETALSGGDIVEIVRMVGGG